MVLPLCLSNHMFTSAWDPSGLSHSLHALSELSFVGHHWSPCRLQPCNPCCVRNEKYV